MELPDAPHEIVNLLLAVVYNGVVEATIEDLRELILLSHRLYISIPLSDDIIQGLELELPVLPPLVTRGPPKLKQRPAFAAPPPPPMPIAAPKPKQLLMGKLPILKPAVEKSKPVIGE